MYREMILIVSAAEGHEQYVGLDLLQGQPRLILDEPDEFELWTMIQPHVFRIVHPGDFLVARAELRARHHRGDRLGRLSLSMKGMAARDTLVMDAARQRESAVGMERDRLRETLGSMREVTASHTTHLARITARAAVLTAASTV